MNGEPVGFLGRWSRRKRGLGEPESATEAGQPDAAPPEAPPRPPAACPVPGLPPVDLSALPPIEALTLGSDFTPFLRPGIPAALRAAALRRMWSLDPEIRDFIGCVEYQWDFNAPGGLPNGFASELGDGLKQLLAQAIGDPDARKPEPVEAADGDPPVEPATLPPAMAEAPAAQGVEEAPAAQGVEEAPAPSGVDVAPPFRRRHGGAMPA